MTYEPGSNTEARSGDRLERGRIRFDKFELDPARGELLCDGTPVRIQPKVYAALRVFISHRGELLSRQALLDALWHDVVVNDEAVTQTLRKLRRVLGDDPKSPRFIETVPKRGYRFIATIEELPAVLAEPEKLAEPEELAEPEKLAEPEESDCRSDAEQGQDEEPDTETSQETPTPSRPELVRTSIPRRARASSAILSTALLLSRALGLVLMLLGLVATRVDAPPRGTNRSVLATITTEPLPARPIASPAPAPLRLTFTTGREHDFDLSIGGTLAIVSMVELDGSMHLFRFEVGGGDPVRLTATRGDDHHPQFISGEDRVLFTRTEGQRSSLWVASTLGGSEALVFPNAIFGAPSPRGESVAVVRATAPGWVIEQRALPPSTEPKTARVLATTRSVPTDLRWSSDGQRLAWIENETLWSLAISEGQARAIGSRIAGARTLAWIPGEDSVMVDGERGLVRVAMATGETAVALPTTNTARSPRFARDGGRLLYIEQRSATEVWVRSEDQARDRVLDIKSSVRCVAPGPSGEWLAFFDTHPRGPQTAMGVIDLATGTRRNVVSNAAGCPAVTADGDALLAPDRDDQGLWMLPLDGNPPVAVVPALEVTNVTPSPLDARLAITTREALVLASLEEQGHQAIAHGQFGRPSWSPDGARIALYGETGGERGTYVIELDTGQLQLVGPHHHPLTAPIWSDARTLLLVANDEGEARMVGVDLDGRTFHDEMVFEHGAAGGHLSVVDVRRGASQRWFYTRRRVDSDLMEAVSWRPSTRGHPSPQN